MESAGQSTEEESALQRRAQEIKGSSLETVDEN